MKHRRKTVFKISYFTKKGKCFRTTHYEYDCLLEDGYPNMKSILSHIRGLANDDSQESGLPGLGGRYWEGPIMVQYGIFAPYIIFPEARIGCRSKTHKACTG